MMNPESIYYLFELGHKIKQEDYIWPIPGKATVNDRVFIVCDGSGSFENGEIASKLICQFMAANVLKFREQKMSGELIDRLLGEARDELIAYARKHRLDNDLASTFSMLILYDERALISWYGDNRMYHLRGGEILLSNEDKSPDSEPIQNTAMARGIIADSSPIYAETRWIEDVRAGDYFLLCSKGLKENITDDDVKSLVSQNDRENIDLARSFKQLAFEKKPDNYSMYLIKVNTGTQKKIKKDGFAAIGKQTKAIRKHVDPIREQIIAIRDKSNGNLTPILILAVMIIGMFILFIYFRNARTSNPSPTYVNQTTQPPDVLHEDSVPNAIVMTAHRKAVPAPTDAAKNNGGNPPATPQGDRPEIQDDEADQTALDQRKRVAQLMIKLTTDESCKLKITNKDLDQVIDWDLSQNDDGTLYLKAGKYSIVATSEITSSKTKTYDFDVKPGSAHTRQNLHIRF
jgi:serine/threonine protein phosphatase PrpC